MIHRLPDHIINKLKAGEIVERPASALKELIENALDAGANQITVSLENGGTTLIQVEDNGTGIARDDYPLLLERYATSKIETENDLEKINTYGFRGEALASIAEVSKVTVQTKTEKDKIGREITKNSLCMDRKDIPVSFVHGTRILVEDLFYNTPVRQKFLKTPQTEYKYCHDICLDFALISRPIAWKLIHNGKIIFTIEGTTTETEKVSALYSENRLPHLQTVHATTPTTTITGYVGDTGLSFSSPDLIKLFVNQRPVDDKVIRKALLDAYKNQFPPREYPFATLFVTILPNLIDVNIHPRKKEIKFLDPGSMFTFVRNSVEKALGTHKVQAGSTSFGGTPAPIKTYHDILDSMKSNTTSTSERDIGLEFHRTPSFPPLLSTKGMKNRPFPSLISPPSSLFPAIAAQNQITIVGQLRNAYIVAHDTETLYYIDQHALAEKILFEKMRKEYCRSSEPVSPGNNIVPTPSVTLATPFSIALPKHLANLEEKVEQLNIVGFDCSLGSETTVLCYGVPAVFVKFPTDIQSAMEKIINEETVSFDAVLTNIFATKACKASIKAGDQLSFPQMEQLVADGFTYIEGMFVCQHGRPFFTAIPKKKVDELFGR